MSTFTLAIVRLNNAPGAKGMCVAERAFIAHGYDGEQQVKAGERFDPDHEIVNAYPQMFRRRRKDAGRIRAKAPRAQSSTSGPLWRLP